MAVEQNSGQEPLPFEPYEEPRYSEGDIELELETTKWYVCDAMIMSINSGQLDRDKAITLLESWFGPDNRVNAAIYKHTYSGRSSSVS